MKKNFRIAALAVAACGLMAACNNNAPAELVDTVVPIDTMVVEEIIDTKAHFYFVPMGRTELMSSH